MVEQYIEPIDIPSVQHTPPYVEPTSSPLKALTVYTPPSPAYPRVTKLARYTPQYFTQDHPMSPRGYKRSSQEVITQPSNPSHPSYQHLLLDHEVLGEAQK